MQLSNSDIKVWFALLVTAFFSFGLSFLPTDNIYKAMELSTSYYTEDFLIKKDLDNDGVCEYIENQSFSDGGHVCSVYKLINDSIYVGCVTDLFDEPYDNTGLGCMMTYYDRDNNSVLFIYKSNGILRNKTKRLDVSNIHFEPLDPMLQDSIYIE
ncbi:hypothetical protein [Oribacterium sp. FC2011]|uniref:hypothetical protein n=1 Tax=Oribacterium sp. FC2011 TaxID=1408311 RepID=UPI0004E27337|nr:hypothetical protein [Oribacterium sp. FC2011]